MSELIAAFRAKGKEFASVLKMGRTQLQDAVPMTLGQEFEAFARDARRARSRRSRRIQRVLCEINMGATAIGTGLNAPQRLRRRSARRTSRRSPGLPIHLAAEPDRGDPGHAGVRPVLLRA